MTKKLQKIKFNFLSSGRYLLGLISIVITTFVLLPLIGLLREGILGIILGELELGYEGLNQIKGTFLLVIYTGLIGGLIGTANGWLLANCKFKGRKFLRIAQLIPLAIPAYLLAATLIDLGSINSIRIYGLFWASIIMALTTYPYVFLLSTESFAVCGKRQLEACRSLGIGPWSSFRKVALPIALPAIGAGIALLAMEVINELGAVQLLNVPSISAGIVENWVANGNPSGAIALALIGLTIVMSLVAYEKILRRRSRRWTEGINNGGDDCKWELKGYRALLAQLITGIPPAMAIGIPLCWAISNIELIHKGLDIELLVITLRSLSLGIAAAFIAVVSSLFLTISNRWNQNRLMKSLNFLSGIGYAIPGAIFALGLFSFAGSPWKMPAIVLLLWGYSDRFLAVSKGGLDASSERLSPSLDEAASGLGYSWFEVLKKVHLPLLKGPITVGALLVFVDTLKELPLSFTLRPFDFDTLSVRIFQYAGDERLGEALVPCLIIIILGLIASLSLIPSLEYKKSKAKI